MNYIDPSQYNQLLKNFAKGTTKQKLQENYVDLRPINTLSEDKPTKMDHINATYPGAKEMEEADLSPKQQKIARMAPPEDKITGADFAAMKKNEGLYNGMVTKEGLRNLSLDERTELKNYVQSIQTTKKAIKELLQKAMTPKMEGGDTTGDFLQIGQQDQPQVGAPEDELEQY